MLDNPFSWIGDLFHDKRMEKWFRLAWSCGLGGFIAFWGTLGTAGWSLLAAGNSPAFALVGGFFSACTMMATVVYLSVRRSDVWKDLSLTLPKELEQIIRNSDVGKVDNRPLPDSTDPEIRKLVS